MYQQNWKKSMKNKNSSSLEKITKMEKITRTKIYK